MANLVFRKIGYTIGSGEALWLRQTPATTIAVDEFFGIPSGSSVFGYIKYWTGSTWAVKPIKYWTGSAWVQKPLKYWNGSAWTLTEYSV
jgi:hypothetical protein